MVLSGPWLTQVLEKRTARVQSLGLEKKQKLLVNPSSGLKVARSSHLDDAVRRPLGLKFGHEVAEKAAVQV